MPFKQMSTNLQHPQLQNLHPNLAHIDSHDVHAAGDCPAIWVAQAPLFKLRAVGVPDFSHQVAIDCKNMNGDFLLRQMGKGNELFKWII